MPIWGSRFSPSALMLISLVVGAVGGVGLAIAHRMRLKVSGSVIADRTPIGTFSFNASHCDIKAPFGQPDSLGFDLHGKGGFLLRVAGSGENARLLFYPQGSISGSIPISKRDCSRWDVEATITPHSFGRPRSLSGHVRIACSAGAGQLTADVAFAGCE